MKWVMLLFAIFYKRLKLFLYQLTSKPIHGPFFLCKTATIIIIQALIKNCFLAFVATDGKDGHGLKLEKVWPTFSSFNIVTIV